MAYPGVPPAHEPRWTGASAGILVLATLIGALWTGNRIVSGDRAMAAPLGLRWPAAGIGQSGSERRETARLAAAAGDVVVNEIDYDLPGTDDAEFVELLNASGSDIALGDLDLLAINGSTAPGSEYLRLELPEATLPSGGYFVIGAAGVPNVDYVVPDAGFLQNGAPDAIAIVQSVPSAPENDILLDSVSYEGDTAGGPSGGGSWTEGSGSGLDDSTTIAYLGLSRFPDGTDSDVNNVDLSRRCISPGEANVEASTSCPPPDSGETATATADAPTATSTEADPTATSTEAAPTATGEPSATATDGASPTATDEAGPTATGEPSPTATSAATVTGTVAATATATASETTTATPLPPTTTATPDPATATATLAMATGSATAPPLGTATPTPFGGPPVATNTALPDATSTGPASPTPVPLAVQLIAFGATRTRSRAVLRWSTASEIDHAGFLLFRRSATRLERLTGRLIPPRGSEMRGASYRYVDREAPPRASYWLADVDTSGRLTWHGPVRPLMSKHPSVDTSKEGER